MQSMDWEKILPVTTGNHTRICTALSTEHLRDLSITRTPVSIDSMYSECHLKFYQDCKHTKNQMKQTAEKIRHTRSEDAVSFLYMYRL